MNIGIHIRDALTNLKTAKLRSALAILGILVGTASVVSMVLCGQLATHQALQQFKALGTDLLAVSINTTARDDQNKLDLTTALKLKNSSPAILSVAPYTHLYLRAAFNGQKVETTTIGATENLADIAKLNMLKGRFVSVLDKYSPFCVLGFDVYQQIKPYSKNPIGKQIQIGNHIFTIVGIIKHWEENSFIYANLNRTVFIPLETSLLISKYTDIHNIVIKLSPDTDIDKTENAISDYFQKNTTNRKLYFRSAKQFIQQMVKQKEILTVFLGLIGSISLLVGGIGIMNIMLVSVTERRQEIGIRFTVGARRRDIQSLFLIEAIMLSLFGGILGIIIGISITFFIALSQHWSFTLFLTPPIVGFTVSVLIGIFFGFYPAYQASKLNPIEVLRSE